MPDIPSSNATTQFKPSLPHTLSFILLLQWPCSGDVIQCHWTTLAVSNTTSNFLCYHSTSHCSQHNCQAAPWIAHRLHLPASPPTARHDSLRGSANLPPRHSRALSRPTPNCPVWGRVGVSFCLLGRGVLLASRIAIWSLESWDCLW